MHHTVDVPPTDGEGDAAAVVEAAPAESHRHARRPPPDRLDAGAGPPPEGDRRLQGLDARALTLSASARSSRVPQPNSGVPIRPFPAAFRRVNRAVSGGCCPLGRRSGRWPMARSRPHRLCNRCSGRARRLAGVGASVQSIRQRSSALRRVRPAGVPGGTPSRRRSIHPSRFRAAATTTGSSSGSYPPQAQRSAAEPAGAGSSHSRCRRRRARRSRPPAAAPPASRAARRSRPTPRRSRATRSSPSRRRRRSSTSRRCFPGSTRSPAASSISTWRSARPCSSARCR